MPSPPVHRPSPALWAILALAAMVRCQHLGDLSFGFDESFCWKMTTFDFGELWRRVAIDNHPPLYFYLLWLWARVFGQSPLALRSLSVVIGLATVAGGYLFVRQGAAMPRGACETAGGMGAAGDERAALLAAALLALSPFQIDWSQQVRMYALGAALALVSSWLLLRALGAERPRRRDFAWYALAAAGLAYTHYFGLFVLAAQFLYAVGWAVGQPWRGLPRPRSSVAPLANDAVEEEAGITGRLTPPARLGRTPPARLRWTAGAFVAVALAWSPWLPVFLGHRRQVIDLFWSRPFTWNQAATTCYQMFAVSGRDPLPPVTLVWAAALACLALAIGMAAFGRRASRLAGLAVLATFDGAISASLCDRNVIVGRYFLFAQAMFLCGLAMVVMRIQASWPRRALAASLLIGAGWLCSQYVQHREEHAAKPGMAAALAYLAEARRPCEPVVVANPLVQITAAAHAIERMPVHVLWEGGPPPYFQGTAVMRDDEYVSPARLAGSPAERLWVIDTVRWIAGAWTVRLPDPWVDVAEETFPEWVSPKCQIVVRRCEKRPGRGAVSDER